MEKSELEAIRAKVDLEPEGSLARILLAEIDRRRKEDEDHARQEIRDYFISKGLTEAETDKVMAHIAAGNPLEHEEGSCRICKGSGTIDEPGCLGVHWERCDECYGSRIVSRIKVPV